MNGVVHARLIEDDVMAGLRAQPKRLPCRLLYDEVGATLFEEITSVDDYYPTRTELRLLEDHLPEIAAEIGIAARVIEPGSGAGIKTRRLLQVLDRPASYVGIDVALESLAYTARVLGAEHPELELHMIAADFTQPLTLPQPARTIGKTLVFFPGSTIGNFEPRDAIAFLSRMLRLAGPSARLLLGADGTHDREALLRAYDDRAGVTARFNKNVLAHLNRTRGTSFDLGAFTHRAVWNETHSRVEMHLVSQAAQRVALDGETLAFAPHEPLVTEYCYKHSYDAMREILDAAGWAPCRVFTAPERPMRLWLCEPRGV